MRNDALMNGGLIGFGVGFILASLALQRVVSIVIPKYAALWHFWGIMIFGLIGLAFGIGFEVYQRVKAKRSQDSNSNP